MACPGDALVACGGGNRISLYGTSATAPTVTPYPHAPVTAYQDEGCWTETAGVRALDGPMGFSATAMTVAECGDYCLNSGYLWFGLEYAQECYCGSALSVNSTSVLPAECNMACSGNVAETCGGSNRLSVYQWV